MPLKDPSVAIFNVDEGRYIIELVDLVDTDPSSLHPEWGPGLRWFFNVYDIDGDPMLNDDGEPGQIAPMTGQSTGPKSTARPWVEALMGRPIENEDTGSSIQAAVLGKRAFALIGVNKNGYPTILSASPLKKAKAAVKAAKPADDEDDD